MHDLATRQAWRRGQGVFVQARAKEEDLARLKIAWKEYAETPDCPICRTTLAQLKLRCMSHYPSLDFKQIEHEVYAEVLAEQLRTIK